MIHKDEDNEEIISDITLECLMNKQQYNKYMNDKTMVKKNNINKDKKFYKKRIVLLTKQLLNNEPPEMLLSDVSNTFELYLKTCIQYFKVKNLISCFI